MGTETTTRMDSGKMVPELEKATYSLGSPRFLRHYHHLNVVSNEDDVIFLIPRMEEQRPDRMVKICGRSKTKT